MGLLQIEAITQKYLAYTRLQLQKESVDFDAFTSTELHPQSTLSQSNNQKLHSVTIRMWIGTLEMNQIEESKGQITKMILPSDPSKYLCDPITNTIVIDMGEYDETLLLLSEMDFYCMIAILNNSILSPNAKLEKLLSCYTEKYCLMRFDYLLESDCFNGDGGVTIIDYTATGRIEDTQTYSEFSIKNLSNIGDSITLIAKSKYSSTCAFLHKKFINQILVHIDENKRIILVKEATSIQALQFELFSDYRACLFILNRLSKEDISDKPLIKDNVSVEASSEPTESLDSLLMQLQSLTGLKRVKQEVASIINLLKIQKIRQQKGMPIIPMSLHLVFSGNPGTGKTTVARLLAKIYHCLGVLSKGQLVEVDRSDLVGGYVGQTAIKTQETIQKALGGVLFIDEAYTLSRMNSPSDYGQEAIDTILKAMEDNRDDLIVIVAGYPDLMKQFVNSNPGLKSRFNKYISFDDYLPNELMSIFCSMCDHNGFLLTEDARQWLESHFIDVYLNRNVSFANGRDVRNLFERAIINQANRLSSDQFLSETDISTLTLTDVSE